MPVIALQGIRGGTGSTSVVSGLAFALQQLGESVLLIDFSPDNLLRLHFNMPFAQSRGWARALVDGIPWQEGAMRYTKLLDFLPFGRTSQKERIDLEATKYPPEADFWQLNLSLLTASKKYRWILLDIPANDSVLTQHALSLTKQIIGVLNPDISCHVRLHQQELKGHRYYLINQYNAAYQLQRDLLQLWQYTIPDLLPLLIHRDEAIAEAFAVKQPLGEYGSNSLAAQELRTLANWCLAHIETSP